MKTDNNFILKPSISEFSKVLVLNWKKDKIFDIQGPFKIGSQPLNRNHLFNKLNLFSTPFVCSGDAIFGNSVPVGNFGRSPRHGSGGRHTRSTSESCAVSRVHHGRRKLGHVF